jgi:Na+-driven multidrug efflux pump
MYFEILCIMISLLQNDTYLAAHTAMIIIDNLYYMVPGGMGEFISQRISEDIARN